MWSLFYSWIRLKTFERIFLCALKKQIEDIFIYFIFQALKYDLMRWWVNYSEWKIPICLQEKNFIWNVFEAFKWQQQTMAPKNFSLISSKKRTKYLKIKQKKTFFSSFICCTELSPPLTFSSWASLYLHFTFSTHFEFMFIHSISEILLQKFLFFFSFFCCVQCFFDYSHMLI